MFSLNNVSLKPSNILFVINVSVHIAAIVVLWALNLSTGWKLVFASLIILSLLHYLYRHLVQASQFSLAAFSWSGEESRLNLKQYNGQILTVNEIIYCVTGPGFIVLRCKTEERLFATPLIVCRDMCSKAEFRRLKVLSRFAQVAH